MESDYGTKAFICKEHEWKPISFVQCRMCSAIINGDCKEKFVHYACDVKHTRYNHMENYDSQLILCKKCYREYICFDIVCECHKKLVDSCNNGGGYSSFVVAKTKLYQGSSFTLVL